MPEQQSDEKAEQPAPQTASEEKQEPETPGPARGYSCYSVELLEQLEE